MKLFVILQLFITGLSSPFRLLKKLSFNKFKILILALKNEPSDLITYNFERFLFTDSNNSVQTIKTSNQLKANYLEAKH